MAKAVKAEIPCVDDPVSKLEDIGDKTQKKLTQSEDSLQEVNSAIKYMFLLVVMLHH